MRNDPSQSMCTSCIELRQAHRTLVREHHQERNGLTCAFGDLSAEQADWNVFVREKNALRGGRDPKKATALDSMASFDLD